MDGKTIAVIGLALCMILCGSGSALGLYKTGAAAAGVIAEDGKKFSKVLLLALLPATQGIYGFVLAVMKISAYSGISGELAAGMPIFGATVLLGITGMVSAILQGKCASACIYAIAKNDSISGKLLLFPAMIEFYAILALVLGIMIPA